MCHASDDGSSMPGIFRDNWTAHKRPSESIICNMECSCWNQRVIITIIMHTLLHHSDIIIYEATLAKSENVIIGLIYNRAHNESPTETCTLYMWIFHSVWSMEYIDVYIFANATLYINIYAFNCVYFMRNGNSFWCGFQSQLKYTIFPCHTHTCIHVHMHGHVNVE